jgi:hypothetical protein
MGKTIAKAVLGMAVLGMLSAMPTLAADLIMKVDSGKKSVAVTNTTQSKVTMLFVKNLDNMNLPLYAQLDSGATVNVPLHFAMPPAVGPAVCDVGGQQRFLTVEVR